MNAWSAQERPTPPRIIVLDTLERVHRIKSAAYGASWRKHGELFSIIPNILRKGDRLEMKTETPDERRIDTVADLAVYCMLYRTWLRENSGGMPLDDLLKTDEPILFHLARVETETHVLTSWRGDFGMDRWEARMLSNVHELERHATRQASYDLPDYRRRSELALSIAAYAVCWLCTAYLEQPDQYAEWAKQWPIS